ncbi:acyl carrier protein [Mucilaginibacter terrigena]|uniref:Acyl carrier protein n=1 Tax=Mucilaginibacter terrigena TaxID=2492395 RepID=A0A4Q5LIM8_9SPHI|nr:acyl carrier protein [Mucilaginibacter terrigena]RYU89261.1 acyl carrier protein [Mucilaginibacter terrigena]
MRVNLKNAPVGNLSNIDPEDVSDVLLKIERSFNIRFTDNDISTIKTFGALCDLVVEKVKLVQSDSCTTQQAFYKLRNAINAKKPIEKCELRPQTKLCELFPRDNRIEVVGELESEMGFHVNLLQPKQWIVYGFAGLLLAAITLSFYNNITGFILAGIAVTGLVLAGKFGKELKVKTLGDLAEKIAREHYLSCRRNASTINRAEVAEKVRELFADYLHVEPASLRKEARFA